MVSSILDKNYNQISSVVTHSSHQWSNVVLQYYMQCISCLWLFQINNLRHLIIIYYTLYSNYNVYMQHLVTLLGALTSIKFLWQSRLAIDTCLFWHAFRRAVHWSWIRKENKICDNTNVYVTNFILGPSCWCQHCSPVEAAPLLQIQ